MFFITNIYRNLTDFNRIIKISFFLFLWAKINPLAKRRVQSCFILDILNLEWPESQDFVFENAGIRLKLTLSFVILIFSNKFFFIFLFFKPFYLHFILYFYIFCLHLTQYFLHLFVYIFHSNFYIFLSLRLGPRRYLLFIILRSVAQWHFFYYFKNFLRLFYITIKLVLPKLLFREQPHYKF